MTSWVNSFKIKNNYLYFYSKLYNRMETFQSIELFQLDISDSNLFSN
jgi:hypothetical protein